MSKREEKITVNEYYGNEFTRSYEAVLINGSKIVEITKKEGGKNESRRIKAD